MIIAIPMSWYLEPQYWYLLRPTVGSLIRPIEDYEAVVGCSEREKNVM